MVHFKRLKLLLTASFEPDNWKEMFNLRKWETPFYPKCSEKEAEEEWSRKRLTLKAEQQGV